MKLVILSVQFYIASDSPQRCNFSVETKSPTLAWHSARYGGNLFTTSAVPVVVPVAIPVSQSDSLSFPLEFHHLVDYAVCVRVYLQKLYSLSPEVEDETEIHI